MGQQSFRKYLLELSTAFAPEHVTILCEEGEFSAGVALESFSEKDLKMPVWKTVLSPATENFTHDKLITLGSRTAPGRGFVIRWSLMRHGWSDKAEGSDVCHYFAPWEWIYLPPCKRYIGGGRLFSLCGKAEFYVGNPFRVSGFYRACGDCERKAQRWTETGVLEKHSDHRVEKHSRDH